MMLEIERGAHARFDRNMPQVEYYGLRNVFRFGQNNRDLYRVVFGGQGSAMLAGRVQDLTARLLLNDIQHGAGAGNSEPRIPDEMLAQMLTGLITRLLFWWLETPNKYSAEQMAAFTYTMLYHRPPPAAEG